MQNKILLRQIIREALAEKPDSLSLQQDKSNQKIVDIIGKGIAVACYTDADFIGKTIARAVRALGISVEKDSSNNPKDWITNSLPQGHAYIVLVDPISLDVTRCDFGTDPCEDSENIDLIKKFRIWMAKTGIPFISLCKVSVRKIGNIDKNANLQDLKRIIADDDVKTYKSKRLVKSIALLDFDTKQGMVEAGRDGQCRLYNLIPTASILQAVLIQQGVPTAIAASIATHTDLYDNCGSYVAKIISRGTGLPTDIASFAALPAMIIETIENIPGINSITI